MVVALQPWPWGSAMVRIVVALFFYVLVPAVGLSDVRVAQGSTGGTLGKTDHEVSGGQQKAFGENDSAARARIAHYLEQIYLRDQEEFDSQVDYYKWGVVSREFVLQDRRSYQSKWPIRKYDLVAGTLEISVQPPTQYVVTYQYSYSVAKKDGDSPKTGTGWTRVTLKVWNDRFLVTGVKDMK
jgi:hypothetical protein